ncbi:MAG: MMPL family transporter, partial [Bdellovibrionia bacterium]
MRRVFFALTGALESIFDKCLRNPKVTAAFFFLLVLACASQFPRLRSELRIYDLKDPRFPSTIELQEVKNQFSVGNSVFVVFSNVDGAPITQTQLCDLQRWLTSEVRSNSELLDTFSPLELRRGVIEDSRLWYKKIFDLDCRKGAPENAAPIAAAMTGSLWVGSLTSKDMNDVAVEFKFRDTEGESRYGRFNPAPIGELWRKIQSDILGTHPELRAYLGGRSAFQWHYQTLLKADAWVNLLTVLVLILCCYFFYRTWTSGIFLVASLAVSLVLLLGGMAAAGAPIDLLTNSLFVMMCVSTIEDLVFVAHALARKREDGTAAFRSLLIPSFLTTFTTVVGFASLGLSDLGIIRRFGTWGAAAAAIEWVVTFYFLPSLITLLGRAHTWVKPATMTWHERVAEIVPGKRWSFAAVILFLIGATGLFRINFNDSPRSAFSSEHIHRQSYDYISKTRGWESTISVLFSSVQEKAKNEEMLRSLQGEPN